MAIRLDTGVLLRAFVPADPHCSTIRHALRQLRRDGEEIVTTCQNIAEFYDVSTRPMSARGGYGLTPAAAETRVRFIERICRRLTENDLAYQRWRQLIVMYQVSGVAVHDARLVAVMLANQINNLMTINERDFVRYAPEGINVFLPNAFIQQLP